jgi:hypothetical protein
MELCMNIVRTSEVGATLAPLVVGSLNVVSMLRNLNAKQRGYRVKSIFGS